MASIFEIIEGITVTKEDIIESEVFAEKYLSAQFPNYDFRQGTALRDMTIRPNATLLAIVNKAIRHYFDDTDIPSITNDTDDEIVDSRLGNFFITRKTGNKSVVVARLFFLFPTGTPITTIIPSTAFFSTDNELKFYPQENITVYPEETEGENHFQYDSASDLWYVNIQLESSESTLEYNIESGDLLYFTIFSPYFLQANIQYQVSSAIIAETNEEMVERSYSAISTRNLINDPSIRSRITDQFNYVKNVYPVGLGHKWLYRDLIDIRDVYIPEQIYTYHRGGHVDVYLNTSPTRSTEQLSAVVDPDTPNNRVFFVSGPIYDIERALEAPLGLDDDTVPIYIDGNDPELGLSPYTFEVSNVSIYTDSIPDTPESDLGLSATQIIKISPTITIDIGDTATFNFKVFNGIGSIHSSINSEKEKVVCADYLARSFEPIFIDLTIGTRTNNLIEEDIVYEAINSYVDNVPNGGSLYVSELINILISNGVRDFQLPLEVYATTYNRHILGDQTGNTNNVAILVEDKVDLLPIQKFYLRSIVYTEVPL